MDNGGADPFHLQANRKRLSDKKTFKDLLSSPGKIVAKAHHQVCILCTEGQALASLLGWSYMKSSYTLTM